MIGREGVWALILTPVIIISMSQILIFNSFTEEVNEIRGGIITPTMEEMITAAKLRYLSSSVAIHTNRVNILLEFGETDELKNNIDRIKKLKQERLGTLDLLKNMSSAQLLKDFSEDAPYRLIRDIESDINVADRLNEKILSDIENSPKTAELQSDISRRITRDLGPVHDRIFEKISTLIGSEVNRTQEARKNLKAVEKSGIRNLYASSIVLVIAYILVALRLSKKF